VDLLHRLDVARLADLALDQIDLGGNLDTARLARPGESFLGLSFELPGLWRSGPAALSCATPA
jgi:hypothetical protein